MSRRCVPVSYTHLDVYKRQGFASTLQDIIDKERPDYIAVAMDMPGGTFRHKEYPEYKANRPETPETIRFSMPYIKELVQAYPVSYTHLTSS